jgi:hypothetical protein
MNAPASHKSLGKDFIGSADSANAHDLEQRTGPLIVGDKTFLLKVGIFFTSLAILTFVFLVSQIGAFPPLVFLIALTSVGLFIFVFRLFNAAHVLRLDEKGMDNRTHGFAGGFIAWEELEECHIVEADSRPMLALTLTDEARNSRDFLTLALMDEHRKSLQCDVILAPEVFGTDPASKYARYLDRLIKNPEAREQLR